MIRAFRESDFDQIKSIHEKFYGNEFSLTDFAKNHIASFTVTDDNDIDKIVCAGAVRTIAEVVLITNKSYSLRARRYALYNVLEASSFLSQQNGYDELHAFVQDPTWENQLLKVGFKKTKGNSLVIGVK